MPWLRRLLVAVAVVAVAVPAVLLRQSSTPTRPPAAAPSPSPSPSLEVRYTVVPAPVPRVDRGLMSRLFALTNNERVRNGLPRLEWWSAATPVAARHTQRMVRDGRLYHNPDLNTWLPVLRVKELGENVGVGPTIEQIQRAFMRSPNHRRNILDRRYRLATMWVMRDERDFIWATVNLGTP